MTGSSRGVGRGIAERLAAAGADVVVHARSEAALEQVAAVTGGLALAADVRDEEAVAGAVAAIRERHGRLDGVVANVGGAAPGAAAGTSADRFRRQLELNLVGGFNVLRAAYPLLREARGAAVLVSATATAGATPLFGAYGAAKAAVEHLTGTLAAEWGPEVRVNCVAPGLIRTEGSLAAVFRGDEALVARAGGDDGGRPDRGARGRRLRLPVPPERCRLVRLGGGAGRRRRPDRGPDAADPARPGGLGR